jgi:telomere length regulation protein
MGAREAAGLSPVVKPDLPRVDFPSKFLPATLHRKYIADNDTRQQVKASHTLIDVAANDIGKQVLAKKGSEASDRADAPLVRERRLRVGKQPTTQRVVDGDTRTQNSTIIIAPPSTVHYKDIAAEYFILPMINRFWSHFENEVTREARARGAFRAAGTGMVLSPLAIAKYLSTLAIMVHAARHSTSFLSIIAPEALELAVLVGQNIKTQPETLMNADGAKDTESEADVVGGALELALVCLDASKELDGGRTLVTDKMNVLMSTGEWAGQLFESEHKGVSTGMNAGGISEGRTRKAAAGVIVLVSEIVESSRHLLGWTMT